MRESKQTTYTEVEIGDETFHIRPFAAFTASNVLGQLNVLLAPLFGGAGPLLKMLFEKDKAMDLDIGEALPALTNTLLTLRGEKVESYLKMLLIQHQNVSWDEHLEKGGTNTVLLTESRANEIFCGNVEDMFTLAYHVIVFNYADFFPKLASQFGFANDKGNETATTENTDISMPAISAI